MREAIKILGKDIKPFDVVTIWYGDRLIIHVEPYNGPLKHLFPDGASIVYWPSDSDPKKLTGMTIDHGDYYQLWRNRE